MSKVGTFSERLVGLIKEFGFTNAELGDKICVAPTAISNYRNSRSYPDLFAINDMCDVFGVTADYLLGREER